MQHASENKRGRSKRAHRRSAAISATRFGDSGCSLVDRGVCSMLSWRKIQRGSSGLGAAAFSEVSKSTSGAEPAAAAAAAGADAETVPFVSAEAGGVTSIRNAGSVLWSDRLGTGCELLDRPANDAGSEACRAKGVRGAPDTSGQAAGAWTSEIESPLAWLLCRMPSPFGR